MIFVTCTITTFIHFLLSYKELRCSLNLKKSFVLADGIKEQLKSCNKLTASFYSESHHNFGFVANLL